MQSETWKRRSVDFTQRIISPDHVRIEVISRGRVYAAHWATQALLDRETIENAWDDDRDSFAPFDTVTGCYC